MSEGTAYIYHLRYFDLKARGEPIRWILKAMGVNYTEERILLKEWPNLKKEFDFGRCPVLEVNGVQLHQTSVICKHLAYTHGLAPSDLWQRTRLEEVAESIDDISEYFANVFGARKAKQELLVDHFVKHGCQRVLEVVVIIEKNIEGDWIRSEKMTWVDIFVAAYMDIYEYYIPCVYNNCPKLRHLVDKIRNIPAIKSWIATRPPSQPFEILNTKHNTINSESSTK